MSKVLVVGADARTSAIVWKLKKDNPNLEIFCTPGNPGVEEFATRLSFGIKEIEEIANWAKVEKPDLTIVAPEAPLVAGLGDLFAGENLAFFGPSKEAAKIEGSKIFFNELTEKFNIPHPKGWAFFEGEQQKAKQKVKELGPKNCVLKADGLCDGKGVALYDDIEDAERWIDETMSGKLFGDSGLRILIQERLEGQEISVMALSNGDDFTLLPIGKDNKRLRDPGASQEYNPNTGGMGGYAPVNDISAVLLRTIKKTVIKPVIEGMKKIGNPFIGVLYGGLMLTKTGPTVIEFNCRFGNPETQVQLPLVEDNLYELLKKCASGKGKLESLKIKEGFIAGVILAAEGYPDDSSTRKGDKIFGLENLNEDFLIFQSGTKRVDGSLVTSGGRVLQVVAYDPESLDNAFNKAYQVIGPDGIHFDKMHYRKVLTGPA